MRINKHTITEYIKAYETRPPPPQEKFGPQDDM